MHTVPTAKLYPDDPRAHLAALRQALHGATVVTLIDRTRGSASWRIRHERIRLHLEAHCRSIETVRAAPVHHWALKNRLQPREQPRYRVAAETWLCSDN